jgi:hypothetical protein
MADISFGGYSKKIIRLTVSLLYRKLHVNSAIIADDLSRTPNEGIKAINTILLAGANQLKPKYQRETVRGLGQLGLWIVYKDTAYRHVFFWIIYQLLKRADKILPLIEPYVKPAEEWYPNVWFDSQAVTDEKVKKGELPKSYKSMEESVFTPQIQDMRHNKILRGK